MPTTPKTPADQPTGAPSPSPDSERYAARAAAPKAVARLYSESRVAEKRANQAEREATSLRRTIDASSEIARRRNALLRNGGLASGTSWELFFVRDVMVYGGGLVLFALFGLHETPRRRWTELWTAAVRRCQGPAELRSTEYARELYAEAVFEILPSIPRHLHEAPGERRNTY